MITPHLDRMASEGYMFTNAYSCGATCVSSRAALYSGLYPHNTGVYGFNSYRGVLNWTHRLKEAGYRTVSIGKTHIGGGEHGYDVRLGDMSNKYQPRYNDGNGPQESLWLTELKEAGLEPPYDLHQTDPDFYDKLAAIEWPLPEEWHFDTWLGRKATEWIENDEDTDEPLFMNCKEVFVRKLFGFDLGKDSRFF